LQTHPPIPPYAKRTPIPLTYPSTLLSVRVMIVEYMNV
jgi:hypothetical protein